MVNKLYLVKKLKTIMSCKQIPLFYPLGLMGGEVVLCVTEMAGFAKVFYCGELFTIPVEYLAVWTQ